MKNKDELARRIGSRVMQIRKQAGLTLKRLAVATELSPALLSRVENGLAMPSIPTLQVIANTMKINIEYFFHPDEEKRYVISHPGDRRVGLSNRGNEVEFLADGIENLFMEPVIATIRASKDEESEMKTHGGQEFLYVLEGRMELTLGEKKFILKKGDSAYFDGNIPHKAISLINKLARILNVHLTPGRRVGVFEPSEEPAKME